LCFGDETGSLFAGGGRTLDCLDHECVWRHTLFLRDGNGALL
jgi:hypothetical protein